MANGPTLPPQAYTREILTSAFNWLQTQPDSVRKLATTPDALVGLFLRAQRFGSSSLESDAPISSASFVSDLKQLAEGLKQFEEPKTRLAKPEPRIAPQYQLTRELNENSFPEPSRHHVEIAPSANRAPHALVQASFAASAASSGASSAHSPGPTSGAVTQVPWQGLLNEKTRQMIQEVKTGLNLSSEAEVVNLMAALAYKSLKDLLV